MVRSSPGDFFWELQPRLIAISATRIEKIVFFIYYFTEVISRCKNRFKSDYLLSFLLHHRVILIQSIRLNKIISRYFNSFEAISNPFCQTYIMSGKMDRMIENRYLFNGYFRTSDISLYFGLLKNIHSFQQR